MTEQEQAETVVTYLRGVLAKAAEKGVLATEIGDTMENIMAAMVVRVAGGLLHALEDSPDVAASVQVVLENGRSDTAHYAAACVREQQWDRKASSRGQA